MYTFSETNDNIEKGAQQLNTFLSAATGLMQAMARALLGDSDSLKYSAVRRKIPKAERQ